MSIDKITVLATALIAIASVYWFFLGKKTKAAKVESGSIEIKVDGGYTPENVEVPVGRTTRITFFRTDPSSCLEEVVMSDFRVRRTLPLNERVQIEIKPDHAGIFRFSCGMGMYHGAVIAK